MGKVYYKGVSFNAYDRTKSIRLTDLELVKQDLINHLFTRRGQRIMMPRFGTRIPDMLMEPMDEISIGIIASDFQEVLDYDPRVEIVDLRIEENFEEKSITASADLFYVELKFTDTFDIQLEFEN